MTAGDVYTVAGSARTASPATSGDGGAGDRRAAVRPVGVAVDPPGTCTSPTPATTGSRRSPPPPAHISTIAGIARRDRPGYTGDGGAGHLRAAGNPDGVAVDPAGDVFIADSANNRVQEIPAAGGTSCGQPMTAGDIYTIAGSAPAPPATPATAAPPPRRC